MKIMKTFLLIGLMGPLAAFADPPAWASNDKDRGAVGGPSDPTIVTSSANALAAAASVSTSEQLQGQAQQQSASATSEGSSASANVGAVSATMDSIVESGAVQSSTNVVSNYKEAAQAVSLVLTTACGTAAGASGREWTFSTAQGQDAFCKNLALANLYLSFGQPVKAQQFIDKAEELAGIDTFFDNFTTIISLGLLK